MRGGRREARSKTRRRLLTTSYCFAQRNSRSNYAFCSSLLLEHSIHTHLSALYGYHPGSASHYPLSARLHRDAEAQLMRMQLRFDVAAYFRDLPDVFKYLVLASALHCLGTHLQGDLKLAARHKTNQYVIAIRVIPLLRLVYSGFLPSVPVAAAPLLTS